MKRVHLKVNVRYFFISTIDLAFAPQYLSANSFYHITFFNGILLFTFIIISHMFNIAKLIFKVQ